MKDYLSSVSKPKSLATHIREAERQVLIRQRCVDVRAATLVRTIHQQLTAPATLLLAGGVGFIIGELTKRQALNGHDIAGKPRIAETPPLRIALNLMTSVHTLYTALPIAWMIKSFYKPDSPERQATGGQARPVAAGDCGRSSR
jgi:hypothetical protein